MLTYIFKIRFGVHWKHNISACYMHIFACMSFQNKSVCRKRRFQASGWLKGRRLLVSYWTLSGHLGQNELVWAIRGCTHADVLAYNKHECLVFDGFTLELLNGAFLQRACPDVGGFHCFSASKSLFLLPEVAPWTMSSVVSDRLSRGFAPFSTSVQVFTASDGVSPHFTCFDHVLGGWRRSERRWVNPTGSGFWFTFSFSLKTSRTDQVQAAGFWQNNSFTTENKTGKQY